MGVGKRAYGTYCEGETGKGKIIWNVNKKYRKEIQKYSMLCSTRFANVNSNTIYIPQYINNTTFFFKKNTIHWG